MAEKTEGGVGPHVSPATKLVVGAIYKVSGTKDNKFWPLDPGAMLPPEPKALDAFAVPSTSVAKDLVTLVAPPDHGIFDIVIQFSRDELKEQRVELEAFVKELHREPVSGTGTADKMYVVINEERRARIRFAVHLPKGVNTFSGKLLLETETPSGDTVKAELKLELDATKSKKIEDLFIFFVPHKSGKGTQLPEARYEWCKLRTVDKAGAGVDGAEVSLKLLRDNVEFEKINRRTELLSQSNGFVGYSADRVVLGLPKDWPLIFRADKGGYVPRGHLFRVEKKETSTNLAPLYKDPAKTKSNRMQIRMTSNADANLAGKLIVIDPGHGVMYADREQPRCQEWLVVQQIADKVEKTLETVHNASVRLARTAGFEAIAPSHTRRGDGPEEARMRYILEFDTNRWRIRIQATNPEPVDMQLKRMSDTLLYNSSSPPATTASRRNALIQNNAATVEQAVTRQIADLKAGLQVEPTSFKWNVADSRFTFRVQREVPAKKGPSTWDAAGEGTLSWVDKPEPGRYKIQVKLDKPSPAEAKGIAKLSVLRITDADWFDLDEEMLRTLEARTVEWSINKEVGGIEQPKAPTDFPRTARAAMTKPGLDTAKYMKEKCKETNDLVASEPALANDLPAPPKKVTRANELSQNRGWNANQRVHYFERFELSPVPPVPPNPSRPYPYCDFFLSLHLNAEDTDPTPIGVLCDIANSPTVEQRRAAKVFVKYLDPLDQGTSGGGIKKSGVRMLQGGDYLKRYVFAELDFMTSTSPRNSKLLQYEEMLEASIKTEEGRNISFIDDAASQLVAAIVEFLVDPQDSTDLDALKHSQWA